LFGDGFVDDQRLERCADRGQTGLASGPRSGFERQRDAALSSPMVITEIAAVCPVVSVIASAVAMTTDVSSSARVTRLATDRQRALQGCADARCRPQILGE
jgi:hypothetical protein